MVVENGKALLHHLSQHRLLGKIRSDDAAQMVVGRLKSRNPAVFPHQNVPVAGAGIELEGLVVEMLPDGIHKHIRIRRGDFPGAVVQDGLFPVGLPLRQGDEIAAEDHIVFLHGDPHAQSLQGRSPGVILRRVIAQHREVGHITAGGHARRHILDRAQNTLACQFIHHWGEGCFHGGFAAQLCNGLIRHAIAKNNDVFHTLCPPCAPIRPLPEDNRYFFTDYNIIFPSGLQCENPTENERISPTKVCNIPWCFRAAP